MKAWFTQYPLNSCVLIEICKAFIWDAIYEMQLTLMNLSSAAEETLGLFLIRFFIIIYYKRHEEEVTLRY